MPSVPSVRNRVAGRRQGEAETVTNWGDLRHGTHICHFYRGKEDLLDILIPYFKAGLKTNQLCLWITSDPIAAEEARLIGDALLRGRRLMHQFEVVDWSQWYTPDPDAADLLRRWLSKLKLARAEGFDGVRFAVNTSWLSKEAWSVFASYEALINRPSVRAQAVVLCSYSLVKQSIIQLVEASSNHQKTLLKTSGKWQFVSRLPQMQGSQTPDLETVLRKARSAESKDVNREGSSRGAMPAELMTVSDAARLLDLSANTIRRWSDGGLLRSYRIGPRKDRRFRKRDLEDLMKEMNAR